MFLVEAFRNHRVLFISLASSAFLMYRSPSHPMNAVRVMAPAHLVAVALGIGAAMLLAPGYVADGTAMVATMFAVVLLNCVYPPAMSIALGFAFFPQQIRAVGFVVLAVAMVATLLILIAALGLGIAPRRTSSSAVINS